MAIVEGSIVADKYRILTRMGEGGMGEIFSAHHADLDRNVALKLLKEAGPMDTDNFARFKREARILAALKHRNLITCYEFGQWNGIAFIAMEQVHGHTLQSELTSNEGLEPDRVLAIATQIAAALDCAHISGVTHRDLKPHNIMICKAEDGKTDLVKLIDFGLAKLLPTDGRTLTKLTRTGVAVGSVAYMAPEQCMGQKVDGRADIYALGAVLHHALRGVPPFDGDNPVAMMHMHLNEKVPPIGRDDLPEGLEELIKVCLEKEPKNRFSTAAELLDALNTVASGNSFGKTPYVPKAPATPAPAAQQEMKTENAAAKKKRALAMPGLIKEEERAQKPISIAGEDEPQKPISITEEGNPQKSITTREGPGKNHIAAIAGLALVCLCVWALHNQLIATITAEKPAPTAPPTPSVFGEAEHSKPKAVVQARASEMDDTANHLFRLAQAAMKAEQYAEASKFFGIVGSITEKSQQPINSHAKAQCAYCAHMLYLQGKIKHPPTTRDIPQVRSLILWDLLQAKLEADNGRLDVAQTLAEEAANEAISHRSESEFTDAQWTLAQIAFRRKNDHDAAKFVRRALRTRSPNDAANAKELLYVVAQEHNLPPEVVLSEVIPSDARINDRKIAFWAYYAQKHSDPFAFYKAVSSLF
jgi:serine/threonine protein kinase